MNRRFLFIFLLITLTAFLISPKICLADDFENITLKEIEKYLPIPEREVNALIHSLINLFHSEWIDQVASPYATAEKMAVPNIMREAARVQALNHLLIDAPIEVAWGIIKGAIEIVKIYFDPAVSLEKLEKLTVEKAIEEGKRQLFQSEVRATPGAIEFKYITRTDEIKTTIFQYVIVYKPINAKRGEIVIRFYSTEYLEPPKNKGTIGFTRGMYTELTHDLSPFIVDIQGVVEDYQWVGTPTMKIDFPPDVPDLGIKPISLWEKYLLKPIEENIKEVEVIITKITGKSLGLVDAWEEFKKIISKIKSFGQAGLVETLLPEEEEPSVEVEQEVGQEILKETGTETPSVEVRPQQPQEQKQLTLEEIQEMLDDIAERIDILSQRAAELVAKSQPISEKIEQIEEEEEIVEEEEIGEEEVEEEVGQRVGQNLCEKILGSSPIRNRVIINEVAWMGSSNSANDEWIELKNVSGTKINLSGWQLLDKDGQIKLIFGRRQTSANGFFMLERTNDESMPGIAADLIYTGTLSNSDEALYLFDENCQLEDEVLANPDWPAGDNSSKRTMERKSDLTWQTSANLGGTPKAENSSGYYGGGGGGTPALPPPTPQFFPIIINEIMYDLEGSDDGREWIEILNTGTSEVDLTNWSFYEKETNHKLTLIRGTATLSANGYAIIADNAEKFLEDHPNYSGTLFDSAFSLSNTGEKIAIKNGDLIINEVTYESSWGANGDGNSLQRFDSQWLATPSTPGRENEFPPPILEVSTTTLNFEAIEDVKKPKDQFLTIQNLGGGNLNWKIPSSESWLKLDPLEGSISSRSSSTINISIDISELTAGKYNTAFTIEAIGAQNSPKQISINLIIYEKKFAKGLVISEVQISGKEFVELYNPTNEAISTAGWYLSYFPSGHDWNDPWRINTQFPTTTIASSTYFLIGFKNYSVEEDYPEPDWQPSTSTNLSDTAGSIGIFSCNPKSASTSEEAMSCKIDLVGWDKKNEISVKEGDSVPPPPEEKSLGRKIAIDDEGNLNYLDLDDNRLDFEIQNPTPGEQNENLPPVAKFDFSPKNPYVGDNILLDASQSRDLDGNISLFIWDFGDEDLSTTSSKITKFFSTSNNFIISLSVVDDLGATSAPTTTQISVSKREPLSIVINEISWMGTKASSSDEWIEFYNTTSEDVDIINWSIFGAKTNECLNFASGTFTTTNISAQGYLIYAHRKEAVKNENGQSIVDIWYDDIEMDNNSPDQLILYDAPNCQGDLIDVVGEINGGWFFGNALTSISMERISATTTGATSTNWANNNLITRNGLDAAGNPIFGTPKSQNSVLKSPTVLTQSNLDELLKYFDEITLTYLGSSYIIGEYPYGNILSVPSGKTLNIESGVVLKFVASSVPGYGSSLEINGTLKAIGEETKPITFTRFEESTGTHWIGIYFSSSSQDSILDWLIIEKARSWDGAHFAIKVDQSSVSFKNLTLEDYYNRWGILFSNSSSTIASSTFSGFNDSSQGSEPGAIYLSQGSPTIKNSIFKKNTYGIKMEQGASPIIEENYFEENKYPIYASDSYPSLTGNQFLRNDVNGILIFGNLSQDTTWKAGITYVIDYYIGVMASTTLTIEPGTIVKFKAASGAPGYQAYFQVAGSLIATGIENSKIVFTSFNDDEYGGDTNNDGISTTPNYWDWKEITFFSGSSGSLKWAIIRYGGWFTNQPLVIEAGANISQENVTIEFFSQP